MYIESLEQVEGIIQNAIESQSKRLDLCFSCSYKSIIPNSIGEILSLEELNIYDYLTFVEKIPITIGQLSRTFER